MSIIILLNQIKNEEIVLPAIQRDFVWPEDKVLRLPDSIMRGYPIGIALLWETYLDLQSRRESSIYAEQLFEMREPRSLLPPLIHDLERLKADLHST